MSLLILLWIKLLLFKSLNFELQNSRGIKLNLIEKIKAKLMKAVYIEAVNAEENIIRI